MPAVKTLALTLAVALLATACPKTRRPVTPEVPSTGSAAARERFRDARARFERDGVITTDDFESIAREYPDDPIAPYALLYAGMSAVRDGAYDEAVARLEELEGQPTADEGLVLRGALFLGIAYTYDGAYDRALPRLEDGERAIATDDEHAEWLAAMAEAHAHTGREMESIGYYDAWYPLGSSPERAYVLERVRTIVAGLEPDEVERAYGALPEKEGPAAALLGARYATQLASDGDLDRADDVRDDIEDAREELGLAAGAAESGGGDPRRVGAVLPLSGRRGRVGDLVMRGLALASGTFSSGEAAGVGAGGAPRAFRLAVRDTASQAASANTAVEDLARDDVIAVLGPVDARSVGGASETASRLGVPLFSLSPRHDASAGDGSPYVFHVVHSAEERARALARHAFRMGRRDFAILAPENGYGRTVGAAFRDEVERLGGTVVVDTGYDPGATSFGEVVKRLRKPWQAVFIPDQARRLELVAPALAAANLISTPATANKPKHGRKILLLSTAEFLTPRYLRTAARYSRGAVFAPGFYPDRTDESIGAFVDRYEAAFGRPPTALDAYAYDAAVVVRAAVESGAEDRDEVGSAVLRSVVAGVTGRVSFDSGRRRRDDGVLFVVEEDEETSEYSIRALRDE